MVDEIGLRGGGNGECFIGPTLRGELEDSCAVRVHPEFGHHPSSEGLRRELQFEDVDGSEHRQFIEVDLGWRELGVERALILGEELADRPTSPEHLLRQRWIDLTLHGAGADEATWHGIDLDAEAGGLSERRRQRTRFDRTKLDD